MLADNEKMIVVRRHKGWLIKTIDADKNTRSLQVTCDDSLLSCIEETLFSKADDPDEIEISVMIKDNGPVNLHIHKDTTANEIKETVKYLEDCFIPAMKRAAK